jgi:hypothetical protein
MNPNESEGSAKHHRYTFWTEELHGSYLFFGNALFQLAVTYSLLTNSSGSNIAGVPMCLCDNYTPAIVKTACSEIDIDEL